MPGILLVDADPTAPQLVEALRRAGAEIELLANGAQAIARARAGRPEAIVLCAELPDSSGYTVCSKLKHDPQLAGVPIVLTSAEATPETFAKHQRLQSRADYYLHKPLRAEALLPVLAKHVQLKPPPAVPPTPTPRPATISSQTKTQLMPVMQLPVMAPSPPQAAAPPAAKAAPIDVAQDLLDISDLLTSLGQPEGVTAAPTPAARPQPPAAAPTPPAAPARAQAPNQQPQVATPRPAPVPARAPAATRAPAPTLAAPPAQAHVSGNAEAQVTALERRVRAMEEAQQRMRGALQAVLEALRDVETAQARLRQAFESALRGADDWPG